MINSDGADRVLFALDASIMKYKVLDSLKLSSHLGWSRAALAVS